MWVDTFADKAPPGQWDSWSWGTPQRGCIKEGFNREMRAMLAGVPGYDVAVGAFDASMNREGHLHQD